MSNWEVAIGNHTASDILLHGLTFLFLTKIGLSYVKLCRNSRDQGPLVQMFHFTDRVLWIVDQSEDLNVGMGYSQGLHSTASGGKWGTLWCDCGCQERATRMSPSHQTTNNTKTSKDGRMNREMRRRAIRPVKDLVKTEDSSSQDMTKVNNLRSNP